MVDIAVLMPAIAYVSLQRLSLMLPMSLLLQMLPVLLSFVLLQPKRRRREYCFLLVLMLFSPYAHTADAVSICDDAVVVAGASSVTIVFVAA